MFKLNTLKNRNILKYDYAFTEMKKTFEISDEAFVNEVRETFFQILHPYLK